MIRNIPRKMKHLNEQINFNHNIQGKPSLKFILSIYFFLNGNRVIKVQISIRTKPELPVICCIARLFRLARRSVRMLHTKQDTSNIPRDLGEGQHHMLVFNVSNHWFSVIAVLTVLHQSLKHRTSTESL